MTKEGIPPAADSLTNIARAENASLTWLLEGKGRPFLVNHYDRYEDAMDYISALREDEAWQPHLITDGARYALVLTLPAQFESKGKLIDYTLLEVIAGHGVGQHVMNLVEHFRGSTPELKRITTTAATMDDLYRGRMGTWALVNAPNALLKQAETVTHWPQMAEDQAAYGDEDLLDAVTDEVLALLEEVGLELPAEKQARLIVTIYRRLLKMGTKPSKEEMKELIKLAK